jgi:hypothetical protein
MLRLLIVSSVALGLMAGGLLGEKGKPEKNGPTIEGLCPAVYAPVICDHGKIYPNQCEADQHHAKNCVPYGV